MAQVRWSLTAGNDLQDIEDFIARDSVLHAITFVDRIVESAETLLKTPQIGRIVPEFNRVPITDHGSSISGASPARAVVSVSRGSAWKRVGRNRCRNQGMRSA